MPGRGPAAAGPRRDLPRGARGNQESAIHMSRSIEIFPDTDTLIEAAGKRLVDTIESVVAARGRFVLVLTGSGNGIALLRYLAAHKDQVDWSKVHLFWGDERYVPEDDDERNEKQAREA